MGRKANKAGSGPLSREEFKRVFAEDNGGADLDEALVEHDRQLQTQWAWNGGPPRPDQIAAIRKEQESAEAAHHGFASVEDFRVAKARGDACVALASANVKAARGRGGFRPGSGAKPKDPSKPCQIPLTIDRDLVRTMHELCVHHGLTPTEYLAGVVEPFIRADWLLHGPEIEREAAEDAEAEASLTDAERAEVEEWAKNGLPEG